MFIGSQLLVEAEKGNSPRDQKELLKKAIP